MPGTSVKVQSGYLESYLHESNGPIAFEVELEDGCMWRRHQDHLLQ